MMKFDPLNLVELLGVDGLNVLVDQRVLFAKLCQKTRRD